MSRFLFLLLAACNAEEEPASDAVDPPVDADGDEDGFAADDDCDDTTASVYPGAAEIAYDGIDQDCADGDLIDRDEDGSDAIEAGGDDCDDGDAAIHPGAEDVPYDGIDQDCSGADLVDVDGDGHGATDCDDADPEVHPDATEIWYDGIDQDCLADCDYDQDHDNAVPVEWHDLVTDGSACDRDPGAGVGVRPDCDDDRAAVSSQGVTSFQPPDGAVDVDAMSQLEVRLREDEFTAVLRLLDANGDEVSSIVTPAAADWFVLMPYDVASGVGPYPLLAYTTYTLEVEHSCGVETSTFTTGEGLGPVDPTGLVGTTWEIVPSTLAYYNWAAMNYFGLDNFAFVSLVATDGATIDLLVAAPDANGDQDLCVPTGAIQGVDFSSNPTFTAAPFDYPVTYLAAGGTVSFPHQAGTLQATILVDEIFAVRMSGMVETEAVADAAGIASNEPCTQFPCVACPDGSGPTCLLEEYSVSGTMQQSNRVIVPRTAAEIAADPGCP